MPWKQTTYQYVTWSVFFFFRLHDNTLKRQIHLYFNLETVISNHMHFCSILLEWSALAYMIKISEFDEGL